MTCVPISNEKQDFWVLVNKHNINTCQNPISWKSDSYLALESLLFTFSQVSSDWYYDQQEPGLWGVFACVFKDIWIK